MKLATSFALSIFVFCLINDFTLSINEPTNSCSSIFRNLLEFIQVLVLKYFDVFQVCYLRSINIIYYLVTDYFIVFYYLFNVSFLGVLNMITSILVLYLCVINNLALLAFTFPNNIIIFLLILINNTRHKIKE